MACVFNTSELKAIAEHAFADKKPILFVHDSGVYLMSAAKRTEEEVKNYDFITYARGCDPNKDEDYYEEARFLVGGDDFGEDLEVSEKFIKNCDEFSEFHIELTETTMECFFTKRKNRAVV